jgi:hypothetical protein
MTTGAVIFAFDNEETDYVAMAAWSAARIRRHLKIPTAVITDCQDPGRLSQFDHVIAADPVTGGTRFFEDYQQTQTWKTLTWYNAGRVDAYALTPWDQTLVLDADYVVCSDQLSVVLDSADDFLSHRMAWDVTGIDNCSGLNWFGDNHMPMWWATVMMFRKSPTSEYIFDCMKMIKENWIHYKDLYHMYGGNFRNDYALSIALGIVSGHTLNVNNIPWGLASIVSGHNLTQIAPDCFQIEYYNQGRLKTIDLQNMDFHAMCKKKQLGDIVANTV